MKILHITKGEPQGAVKAIIDNHTSNHEVTVVDVNENKDYDRLLDLILENDRVITW